tara:strand:+ start:722 stop:1999 length:1278 start_codon:yes stop_codon:yes gene_type:complete
MKILNYNNRSFFNILNKSLDRRNTNNNIKIEVNVKKIINDVKINKDKALFKYSSKFDKIKIKKLELNYKSINRKLHVEKKIINSFKKAISNVSKFHKKQLPLDLYQNKNNVTLRSRWKPIDSVGLYVPGGKAFYPSSLIMNVIPAKIAGVKRIVCVTPPTLNINPYFLALVKELKINEVYSVGGAQAIAALALGTETIKPVNKIFGPGNAYVAEAKKQLFGKVGIDLIAGPSEIVVVANKSNNPSWVAADLMAQAEHDVNAQSILITDDNEFAKNVLFEIKKLKKSLLKKNIIEQSLNKNGIIIIIDNINDCADIINFIAPEHLHIQTKSYKKLLSKINNAGGIFLGKYSVEAFGDYIVGTNHVLPTSGAAKFSSGLGVLDFMKRNSIVEMNNKSYNNLKNDVINIANIEGLDAHKMSVKIRQKK